MSTVPSKSSCFPLALAGTSADAERARQACAAAAADRMPVLIVAEEGFDTHGIARQIHEASRPGAPFLAVNGADADPADVEIALFGVRERAGARAVEVLGAAAALLRAAGGTLFIHGLDDLPSVVQRRLARLLRDGEARANGRGSVPLDARIIASTPPGIRSEVADGRVRADLYRRLIAHELIVPPLRVRREDFAALVPALAAAVAGKLGVPTPTFTASALTVLAALPWRRNLVELEALLDRIIRAVGDGGIKQEDVLAQLSFDSAFAQRVPAGSLREARLRFERQYIAAVLEHHQWRMSEAARTLGIERANLYRKTRQLGISRGAPPHAAAER